MIKTEQDIIYLIEKGQSGLYDENAWLIRQYAGDIRQVIELGNPLDGSIHADQIDKFLQIINPSFENEIEWFKEMQRALKLWVNDLVTTNRVLGIKNDNEYNRESFKKAIMQHFFLVKEPKPEAVIETNFKTMVELVELGARRFKR